MTENIHQNMEGAEGIVIDFGAIFCALIRNASIILAVALMGGLLMMLSTDKSENYTYSASSTAYIVNKDPDVDITTVATADTTAGQALVKLYSNVMTKNELFLTEVLKAAQLEDRYQAKNIGKYISVSALNSTQMMTITVTMTNPKHALRIAQAIEAVGPINLPNIISGSSMTVISSASFPSTSVTKNLKKSLLLGGVLGGIVGVCLVIFFFVIDRRAKSSLSVKLMYDLPLFAEVPAVGKKQCAYSSNAPKAVKNAWKKAAVKLGLYADSGERKVFLLTGPCGKEGVSTAAESLCAVLTATGRTCAVLTAADVCDASGEFSGTLYVEKLRKLSEKNDLVLVDSPAVLKNPDTLIQAAKADGVLAVVRNGRTGLDRIGEMLRELTSAGAEVIGFLYNEAGDSVL